MIEENKYNYIVNSITENETGAQDDIIFVKDTNYYTLKKKVINNNNESSYELYEVPINSKVLIKDIQDIYRLYNYIDINNEKKQIWSNDIKTDELIVGKITPNYRPNITSQFTQEWIGITNIYTYILTNNHKDVYYIHNKSLGITKINIDYNNDNEQIYGAFIYNDNLYLMIAENNTTLTTIKINRLIVYNTSFKIHTYNMINYNLNVSNQYFINTINMNNDNDIYLVLNNAIYLLLFYNNVPIDLILLYPPTNEQNEQNDIINDQINIIHNLNQYLYILCDTKFYKYDINNETLDEYLYNTNSTLTINYDYSIVNSIQNKIYIKQSNDNNIYYLDETQTIKIQKYNIPDETEDFNDKICKFNVINNKLYILKEIKLNDIYHHIFYLYKINKIQTQTQIIETLELIYKYELENYILQIQYKSNIPIIDSLGDFVFLEPNYLFIPPPPFPPPSVYYFCRLIPPIMVISNNETYIKNVRISDDEIVLAANTIIMPNDIVTSKLVTKDIIIKNNGIYITDTTHTSKHQIFHYYQTQKAIFNYQSAANSSGLHAFSLPNLPVLNKYNFFNDKDNTKTMQSSFVYNDILYVLFENTSTTDTKPKGIYFQTFDLQQKNNNSSTVLLDTIFINTNGYVINKYFYDECIVINDTLYILNANYNETSRAVLYKCDLLKYDDDGKLTFNEVVDLSDTDLMTNTNIITGNNTNNSNVSQIIYNNNILYFIYYITVSNIKQYKIYIFDLNRVNEIIGTFVDENNITHNVIYKGYSISLYVNINEETTQPISLLNYSIMNNDTLYLNIIDQNGNLRGIFYLNDFSESTEPKLVKKYPLFQDNAYSFNIIEDMFYVITTQNYQETTSGPQLYTYYINYYNQTENLLQSSKIIEKKNYSKFGIIVPPLVSDNVIIMLIDSNNVYNVFTASLFTHMFAQDRSIINNNVVITPNFAQLLNNLYITSSKCTINTNVNCNIIYTCQKK